jgi:hypothetical protein
MDTTTNEVSNGKPQDEKMEGVDEAKSVVTTTINLPVIIKPKVIPPKDPYKILPPVEYEDWVYNMRRTMQEIIPGLYLGPYSSAAKNSLDTLKDAGITHIICNNKKSFSNSNLFMKL